jgi:hypothetical protein
VRVIDVGCFRVDLFYHPHAFTPFNAALEQLRKMPGDRSSGEAAHWLHRPGADLPRVLEPSDAMRLLPR